MRRTTSATTTTARWRWASAGALTIGVALASGRMASSNMAAPRRDRPQREAALQRIEELGGQISPSFHGDEGPSRYRAVFLEISLGPSWRGGEDALAELADVDEVYQLTLDSPTLDDAALASLPSSLQLEGVTFQDAKVGDRGLQFLGKVQNLRTVSVADASHVTDAGVAALAGHRLQWLELERRSQVTDAGLQRLGEVTSLLWLRLPGALLYGRGLPHIAQLEELRYLDLRDTQISDEALLQLPLLGRLRRLDLSGTLVRGPGLARVRQLPRLTELALDRTAVDDEGLQQLKGCEHLEFLSLRGAKTSSQGVRNLGIQHLRYAGNDEPPP